MKTSESSTKKPERSSSDKWNEIHDEYRKDHPEAVDEDGFICLIHKK